MDTILNLLWEPFFWLLATIYSVALNVASNLLTPRFSKWLFRLSSKRQDKRKNALKEDWRHVLLYCNEIDLFINDQVHGIFNLLIGLFFLAITSLPLVASSVTHFVPQSIGLLFLSFGLLTAMLLVKYSEIKVRLLVAAHRRIHAERTYRLQTGYLPNSKEVRDHMAAWDAAQFGVELEDSDRDPADSTGN
jgi:hypothetical protein